MLLKNQRDNRNYPNRSVNVIRNTAVIIWLFLMSALMGQSGRNIAIIDGTFFNLSSANYPDYYLLCNDIESINVSFVSDNEGVIVENQIWWGNYMIGYACQINFDSLSTEELTTIPDRIIVSPNYPNPFNPETTLEVSLSNSGNVEIFDISPKL